MTVFANHLADFVANFFRSAFWNHLASRPVDNFAAALRNHFANSVVANLGAALRNSLAHGVRHFASTALTNVLGASYFLGFASWNPNSLGASRWATLNAFYAAFAWAVYAAASRRIVSPSSGLTNGTTHHFARDRFSNGVPVTTFDLDGLGVLLRNDNAVVLSANALLFHGVVDRVVDRTRFLLTNRYHHGVVDGLAVVFTHRVHDSVIYCLSASFPHRLTHGVVDHLLVSLVHRLHDRVVDRLGVLFVNRLAHRVVDHSRASFVNGLHHGVVDRLGTIFNVRNVHSVLNFTSRRDRNHAAAGHFLIFVVSFIASAVTSLFDLLVNRFAYVAHDGVSTTSNGTVINDGSVTSDCTFGNASFDNCASTAATAFIADCATIGSAS
ncbi:hypothetical protein RMSM_06344 [Rhodopirellula maiorica SM1]|uniref:Uncharacterized protein n=1 Tax=Rhodopirellula maiorica SM1 TaxID=1265738 RepID=M5RMX9_9BACT|nr:hypothetical protein RMSM_06344 [Rhodopirellula maiorica SM1]